MKFTQEITIHSPLSRVLALFDDPKNLKHWQPELLSFMPLSGTPGEPGATSKLVYNMNGRTLEMIETITVRNLPKEFAGTYEINGMTHRISNHFSALDEKTTKMISESDVRFSGFMKIMSLFLLRSIRAQTKKYLKNFQSFVESGTDQSRTRQKAGHIPSSLSA